MTTEISVIPDYLPYICDFDFSGFIDWPDIGYFIERWLYGNCIVQDYWCEGADLDKSGTTDFKDWAYFTDHWLIE